jgi:flagellar basal-body rod modification protein FlgD
MSTTNPVGSSTPVSSIPSSTAATAAQQASSSASSADNLQLTQADFLQLMTTELQDQNPMQPADPTQFLGQLAQMSEVSSLQSMQTSLSGLATSLQSSQMLNGAALLGKQVLAPGSTAQLTAGGSVTGAVSAPSGATSLTVTITNASGALVNSFSVSPQSAGLTNFTWNGTSSNGTAAAAGTYSISVSATVGGAAQAVSPLIASTVNSVTLDPTTQGLDVNTVNGTVPLSSVVSIL